MDLFEKVKEKGVLIAAHRGVAVVILRAIQLKRLKQLSYRGRISWKWMYLRQRIPNCIFSIQVRNGCS